MYRCWLAGALVGLRDAKSLAGRDSNSHNQPDSEANSGPHNAGLPRSGRGRAQLLQIGGWLGRWHWGGSMRPGRALRLGYLTRASARSTAAVALAGCHTAASDRQRPPQQLGEPGRLQVAHWQVSLPPGFNR
jgi:hypothetical protein